MSEQDNDKELAAANARLMERRAEPPKHVPDLSPPEDGTERANREQGSDVITDRLMALATEAARARDAFNGWAAGQPTTQPCPVHGTIRSVDRDESWRASSLGKKFVLRFQSCPACADEKRIEADREWMIEAGVPANLLHCTLNNWQVVSNEDRSAVATLREFVSRKRGFVTIAGVAFGIGKSHLAVGCLREIGQGEMITQHELVSAIRKPFDIRGKEDVVGRCKHTRFFILDEAGFSAEGRDVLPTIHEILNYRYGMRKPTLITTNLTEAEFLKAVGPRMADRLDEAMLEFIVLTGKSRRANRRGSYLD